jgi:hypothetical protein
VRLRTMVAVSLIAALSATLAVSPSAAVAAIDKAIWGPTNQVDGSSAFPLYRSLGVDVYEGHLQWADVAPTAPADATNPNDPAYHWPAGLQETIQGAGSNGIAVALLVSGSPGWANGGRSSIWAPNAGDFASFLIAASRRYPQVRRWMIWGEPNRGDRFQPNAADQPTGPRAYAPLLDAAYGALKSVSSRNIVIGGMTWTGGDVKPDAFLRWMELPSGGRPRLDWFGHNPFPLREPNIQDDPVSGGYRDISDMDTFSGEVRNVFGAGTKLWLSEFTVVSDHRSALFGEMFTTKENQARWLAEAYRMTDDLPGVAGLGWISLYDEAPSKSAANWGLMTAGGARKPAFEAYRKAPDHGFAASGQRGVSGGRLKTRITGAFRAARRGAAVVASAKGTIRIRGDRAGRPLSFYCGGKVRVGVRAGRHGRSLAVRRVKVSRSRCRWRKRLYFPVRKLTSAQRRALASRRRVRLRVRFVYGGGVRLQPSRTRLLTYSVKPR